MKNLINSLLRLSLVALLSMAIGTNGMCQSSSDKAETQKLQKKVKDVEDRVQDVVKDVEQDQARDRKKEKRDQSDKASGKKDVIHGEDVTSAKSLDIPDYNSDEQKVIRKDRKDRRHARLLRANEKSDNVDKDYEDAVQGQGKSRGASALSANEQRTIGSRTSAHEAISDAEATLNEARAWLQAQKARLDQELASGAITQEEYDQELAKLAVLRAQMQALEDDIANGKNIDEAVESSGLLPGMVN